jgi:glycosyltransferase involved in cell wall biosynthesis
VVEGAGVVADGVEAMGEALQELRAFPEERQRRGAAVRQRVLDRYTDAALARETMALWREVLAGRAPLNRSA